MTFYSDVLAWATARNIPKGSTASKQRTKTFEEAGELAGGLAKSKMDVIKDSIGDAAVTTANTAACLQIEILPGTGTYSSFATAEEIADADTDELLRLFMLESASVRNGFAYYDSNNKHIHSALYLLERIAIAQGVSFKECQQQAWNDIKDRKGMMLNGTFVKEADIESSITSMLEQDIQNDPNLEHLGFFESPGSWEATMDSVVDKLFYRLCGMDSNYTSAITVAARILEPAAYAAGLRGEPVNTWSSADQIIGSIQVRAVLPGDMPVTINLLTTSHRQLPVAERQEFVADQTVANNFGEWLNDYIIKHESTVAKGVEDKIFTSYRDGWISIRGATETPESASLAGIEVVREVVGGTSPTVQFGLQTAYVVTVRDATDPNLLRIGQYYASAPVDETTE